MRDTQIEIYQEKETMIDKLREREREREAHTDRKRPDKERPTKTNRV
jgi:hypothetical protein